MALDASNQWLPDARSEEQYQQDVRDQWIAEWLRERAVQSDRGNEDAVAACDAALTHLGYKPPRRETATRKPKETR